MPPFSDFPHSADVYPNAPNDAKRKSRHRNRPKVDDGQGRLLSPTSLSRQRRRQLAYQGLVNPPTPTPQPEGAPSASSTRPPPLSSGDGKRPPQLHPAPTRAQYLTATAEAATGRAVDRTYREIPAQSSSQASSRRRRRDDQRARQTMAPPPLPPSAKRQAGPSRNERPQASSSRQQAEASSSRQGRAPARDPSQQPSESPREHAHAASPAPSSGGQGETPHRDRKRWKRQQQRQQKKAASKANRPAKQNLLQAQGASRGASVVASPLRQASSSGAQAKGPLRSVASKRRERSKKDRSSFQQLTWENGRARRQRRRVRAADLILPRYKAPEAPTDEKGIEALERLVKSKTYGVKQSKHLGASVKNLQDMIRDINDAFCERKTMYRVIKRRELRQRQQRQAHGEEDSSDDDDENEPKGLKSRSGQMIEPMYSRLRTQVPALSKECDASMRKVVNRIGRLQHMREGIAEAKTAVELEVANMRELPSRDTPKHLRPYSDFLGPLARWNDAWNKPYTEWRTLRLWQRYGQNNDYAHFKRLWHDALHGEDGKPLKDVTEWFLKEDQGRWERGYAYEGPSESSATDEYADSEEETGKRERHRSPEMDTELVVSKEKQSLLCPLSMRLMSDPYTSRLCKHSYDKESIDEYLMRARGGLAQCPQTGCSKMVSMKDLYADEIVLRHVKREQQRIANDKQRRTGRGDDDSDEMDDDNGRAGARQATSPRNRKRSASAVHSSPLVDRRRQRREQ